MFFLSAWSATLYLPSRSVLFTRVLFTLYSFVGRLRAKTRQGVWCKLQTSAKHLRKKAATCNRGLFSHEPRHGVHRNLKAKMREGQTRCRWSVNTGAVTTCVYMYMCNML